MEELDHVDGTRSGADHRDLDLVESKLVADLGRLALHITRILNPREHPRAELLHRRGGEKKNPGRTCTSTSTTARGSGQVVTCQPSSIGS